MKITKMTELGKRVYESFCLCWPSIKVMTPKTNTLELFGLLSTHGEEHSLLKEMMDEFTKNLDFYEFTVTDNQLYEITKNYKLME